MKKYFEEITLESLVLYVEGNASPEDSESIESWITSDPQNLIFFNKIKDAWKEIKDIAQLHEHIDKDWQKVFAKMGNEAGESGKVKLRTSRNLWYKAAAIALIFVTIGGGYYLFRDSFSSTGMESKLGFNEVRVPKGERSYIQLSDGTKVWLNAETRIKFPDKFGEKSREVWLDGEAYFEVAKNKSVPFYVHTNYLNVKVHGTSFNIKAYNDEDIIETTLIEGSVSIQKKGSSGKSGEEVFLKPNHKAIFLKRKTRIITEEIKNEVQEPVVPNKVIISDPVEVEPITSWKEGKMVFNDETFESIARKLERRYDVEISIEDEEVKQLRYTGVLKNVTAEQAIKAIQLTTNYQFEIDENKIVIYGNK